MPNLMSKSLICVSSHHSVLPLLALALARSVRSCLRPLEIASVTSSVLVLPSSSFELFDAPFEEVIPPLSPISESPASHRTPVADIETGLESDNESVPSLEELSPEANKHEAGSTSSPSTAVSQWQSNVKPTESGGATVQDAQAAQVQPEVPLLSESASMNTIKLAAPMNVSGKITLKITDAHRTVMFATSINMMPLIDLTFTGFVIGEPLSVLIRT